jgi:hypothetical protein
MCCIGRWTVDELKDMIALLQQADFDPTDVDTDLHKRVSSAIQDGFIKRFDMRVSSRDGDQDLSMWMRDVEEVVREIMGDTRFAGHQHFNFEAAVDEDGQRLYGGEANEGVAFQIGQIR